MVESTDFVESIKMLADCRPGSGRCPALQSSVRNGQPILQHEMQVRGFSPHPLPARPTNHQLQSKAGCQA